MINTLKLLLAIYLLIVFLYCFKKIISYRCNCVYFIICVYFIFFGIPLFFDLLLGVPTYEKYYGFYISSNDFLTNIIYLLYIFLIPIILIKFGKKEELDLENIIESNHNVTKDKHNKFNGNIRVKILLSYIILMVAYIPLILVLFAPEPELYIKYGYVGVNRTSFAGTNIYYHYEIISRFCMISILCFILYSKMFEKINFWNILIIMPSQLISIWLVGKRYIVALFVFVLIYILWNKRVLKKKTFTFVCMALFFLLMTYSFLYQYNQRKNMVLFSNYNQIYTNYRIDYGRDDVVKMSIYSELYPQTMKILEYKGQSFIYNMLFFVPRKIWNEKPWPYSVYLTKALFNLKSSEYIGWGITSSIFAEFISNFGLVGMLLAPLALAFLCRLGDKYSFSSSTLILTIIVGTLFVVLQLAAFWYIFLIFILALINAKIKMIDRR